MHYKPIKFESPFFVSYCMRSVCFSFFLSVCLFSWSHLLGYLNQTHHRPLAGVWFPKLRCRFKSRSLSFSMKLLEMDKPRAGAQLEVTLLAATLKSQGSIPSRRKILLFSRWAILILGPTQPSVKWYWLFFPCGLKRYYFNLTTDIHLVPRLRKRGSTPPHLCIIPCYFTFYIIICYINQEI